MTNIDMIETPASSNIHSVGYDADNSVLYIRFKDKNGNPTALWRYEGVLAGEYKAFMGAPSLGKYFQHYIKGTYPGSKAE